MNLKYTNNDSKKIKYEDNEIFVINKNKKEKLIFPKYITDMADKYKRHNAKQNFRRTCKGYNYDFKLNRLTKTINISNKKNKPNYKTYIVAYEFEKYKLIRFLH